MTQGWKQGVAAHADDLDDAAEVFEEGELLTTTNGEGGGQQDTTGVSTTSTTGFSTTGFLQKAGGKQAGGPSAKSVVQKAGGPSAKSVVAKTATSGARTAQSAQPAAPRKPGSLGRKKAAAARADDDSPAPVQASKPGGPVSKAQVVHSYNAHPTSTMIDPRTGARQQVPTTHSPFSRGRTLVRETHTFQQPGWDMPYFDSSTWTAAQRSIQRLQLTGPGSNGRDGSWRRRSLSPMNRGAHAVGFRPNCYTGPARPRTPEFGVDVQGPHRLPKLEPGGTVNFFPDDGTGCHAVTGRRIRSRSPPTPNLLHLPKPLGVGVVPVSVRSLPLESNERDRSPLPSEMPSPSVGIPLGLFSHRRIRDEDTLGRLSAEVEGEGILKPPTTWRDRSAPPQLMRIWRSDGTLVSGQMTEVKEDLTLTNAEEVVNPVHAKHAE